ncbi:MAG: hypothetical protein HC933_01770 [Pleurocapsa sp. SU_196_0]|nr:hypothetical protein [Pleurocapsa sp. SU_196_0]
MPLTSFSYQPTISPRSLNAMSCKFVTATVSGLPSFVTSTCFHALCTLASAVEVNAPKHNSAASAPRTLDLLRIELLE